MVGIEPAKFELLNDLLPCGRSTIKLEQGNNLQEMFQFC